MTDPNNDEHRLIIGANATDPKLIDAIEQLMKEDREALGNALKSITRLEIADVETMNQLIKEFSGLQINLPKEGLKDMQIIENAQTGIQIMFMHSPGRFGIIVAFYIPIEPGTLLFKPLSVGGLTVCLKQEDGTLLQPKIKGDAEGFLFEVTPGNVFKLELSL